MSQTISISIESTFSLVIIVNFVTDPKTDIDISTRNYTYKFCRIAVLKNEAYEHRNVYSYRHPSIWLFQRIR